MDRAYSILTVKSLDENQRVIRGIATTPETDRQGDIVVPGGVKFKNPLALLWQHHADKPVGTVTFDKPTEKGITFEAQLPKIEEPGVLRDRVDEAWQSIKAGLVTAVSTGFRSLEDGYEVMKTGGIKFMKTEVLELSLVTIPANASATITSIKSIDDSLLAASGRKTEPPDPPGDSGIKRPATKRVFLRPEKGKTVKTIQEQIAAFEAKRTAAHDQREEIMGKSFESGETLDTEQKETYDGLSAEIKEVDEHLVRLHEHERTMVQKAVKIELASGTDPQKATDVRSGIISVKANALPGSDYVRYAMAIMQAKGNLMQAHHIATTRWRDSPRVTTSLKAAMDAGTTSDATWASPLVEYQTMASEFIELLRPMTLLGRIPGIRRVPFNVRIQRQTAGVTGAFVGEGLAKPVNELAFDAITMGFHKVAVIVVMTMELMRLSDPNAEGLVRQDMIDGLQAFLDKRFIDPQYSATSVSPASITNGVAPTASTGSTIAAITNDVETMLNVLITANMDYTRAVWIMSPATALSLSMKRDTQDRFIFETVSPSGGTFFGRPVITSNHVAAAGSPTEQLIVLMDPGEILLADDGALSIDMSQEASLQMDNAPSAGAQSLVSLWQNNLAALRAEKMITWRKRRDAGVQVLGNANW